MTCRIVRRLTCAAGVTGGRRTRRWKIRMGVVAARALLVFSLIAPRLASAQETVMSTTVVPLASGAATSRTSFNPANPKPDRGLTLPSLSLTDDGNGPTVRSLLLQMPEADFGGVPVASSLGDQQLPAAIRAGALAGPALSSNVRGVTLRTTGSTPLNVSFGQIPVKTSGVRPDSPAFAAATMSFSPISRLSVTPQMLIPSGSPDARTSVGTGIRANVPGNLALTTDVGFAGNADTAWSPLTSARLVGQWPRAGIETVMLRGAAAPSTPGNTAFVASRDRQAAQAQLQPLKGLTFAALTSISRPSSDPVANDTTLNSLRIAYDGLRSGQLAAMQQREATASRSSDTTSVEWRQRSLGRMTVRYVRRSASDPAAAVANTSASRVEVELPVMAPISARGLDLRAALTAGSISPTESGVNSRFTGRLALIDKTLLTGETELGLTGADHQVLRGLKLTTEMPVVPATRLQFSYAYRTAPQLPLGQVFEAHIVRRISLGW